MKYLFPDGYNANLGYIYIFSFLSNVSRAIWEGNVISSYIYLIASEKNFVVGSLTGLSGLAQLIFSPIFGYAADRFPRTFILNCASVLGVLATIFTSIAVLRGKIELFVVSMILFGMFWSCVSPTTDALLADVVKDGSRSVVYTARLSIVNIAGAFGPLLSMFLFLYLGDHWSRNSCKIVMMCGLVMFFAPCFVLTLFHSDSQESRPFVAQMLQHLQTIRTRLFYGSQSYSKLPAHEYELADTITNLSAPILLSSDMIEAGDGFIDMDDVFEGKEYEIIDFENSDIIANKLSERMQQIVPLMILLGDMITGFASGMTVKFFPIYFMDTLRLGPVLVSLIYTVRHLPSD